MTDFNMPPGVSARDIPGQDEAPWQPIETAPRDRTSVLLLGRGGKHADGFWEPKAYAGNGCWVWPYVKCEPSHWMPLPPPPAARAKGKE